MTYKELQAECKKRGLPATGKKAELEARLAGGNRSFVFTGHPYKAHADDPETITYSHTYENVYEFKLNGPAVAVDNVTAEKLAVHSHFTEK